MLLESKADVVNVGVKRPPLLVWGLLLAVDVVGAGSVGAAFAEKKVMIGMMVMMMMMLAMAAMVLAAAVAMIIEIVMALVVRTDSGMIAIAVLAVLGQKTGALGDEG